MNKYGDNQMFENHNQIIYFVISNINTLSSYIPNQIISKFWKI